MKYFWIPAAVLALLMGAALWNARTAEATILPWCDALETAGEAAAVEDWETAARLARETHAQWEARHPYFHIVTAHDELDRADALFATSESFASERDAHEFRAAVAELAVQLRVVAEMQKLTVKNVL